MLTLDEARNLLLGMVENLSGEVVTLEEAPGRVLAERVVADADLPPFDRAAVDGYALLEEDLGVVNLTVVGEVAAGTVPAVSLQRGQTMRVSTGALLPGGTAAVVRKEDVIESRDGSSVTVRTRALPGRGDNISCQGEDMRKGQTALKAGTRLRPVEIGLLAALGKGSVIVHRQPRVAIIPTGSELVSVGMPLGPGKIWNSNGPLLGAEVNAAGGWPVVFEPVCDEAQAIRAAVARAADLGAQVIITTGGASVGEHDLTVTVVRELGARILFPGLLVKPGTRTVGASLGDSLLFCLSGNPAAGLLAFHLIIRPVLLKIGGLRQVLPKQIRAVVENHFTRESRLARYLRAQLWLDGDRWRARLPQAQRPGILSSMVAANGYVVVPPGHGPVRAGQVLEGVLPFETGL